jgi:dynein heavy chain, axonemal
MQVPEQWVQLAYPSTTSLTPWLKDLKARTEFVGSWLYDGPPKATWLPGLFDPRSFLTSVLQKHARLHAIAIDSLGFDIQPTNFASASAILEVWLCENGMY